METAVSYDVSYPEDATYPDNGLTLVIRGPNGMPLPTREARLDGDTLRFAFDEPEAELPLTCALGRDSEDGFAGRCTDPGGQWVWFTMRPPPPWDPFNRPNVPR